MKIKAIRDYYDRELEKVIKEGVVYEVDKKRGDYLIGREFAEEVKGTKNGKRKSL